MFSLTELKRSARLLEPLLDGSRLQKIIQPSADKLVLELYGFDEVAGKSTKRWLVMKAAAKNPYLALVATPPESPPWPPEFAALVKAKAHRNFLKGVRIVNDDRQIALLFEGKEGAYEILFSMMGTQSNVYLIDIDGKLQGAMRELTRQDLKIGSQWVDPSRPENRSEGEDKWAEIDDADFLKTVGEHFTAAEATQDLEHLKQQCQIVLNRERKSLDKRAGKLRKDIEQAKRNEKLKIQGELLKQVIGQVKRGDESVTAINYETGEEVEIKLDSLLEPAANMERLFKKYKKGVVGEVKLGEQLVKIEAELVPLNELQAGLDAANDMAALKELAETGKLLELRKEHYPDEFQPKRRPKKEKVESDLPGKLQPKRYLSSDGLEIWVGKSDAGNDYLTTRLANGKDWFFHVHGYPGSHPEPRRSLNRESQCVSLLPNLYATKRKDCGNHQEHD